MLRAGRAARARGRPRRSCWSIAYGAFFTATRVNLDTLRQRARLPRPVARRARGAPPQPDGARGAALRPGLRPDPQADPRRALDPRPPASTTWSRAPTRRSKAQRSRRGVARLPTSRQRSCARASRRTSRRRTTSRLGAAARLHARRDDSVLRRLRPLLSRAVAGGAGAGTGEGARAGPAAPARPAAGGA